MSLTPVRIAPTPALIDAALHNDRVRLSRCNYTIAPAKMRLADKCYGDRIVVRIEKGSWSATITIEDVSCPADGAPDWYADAKIGALTATEATVYTLSDDIMALRLVRDVLCTICTAIGQNIV